MFVYAPSLPPSHAAPPGERFGPVGSPVSTVSLSSCFPSCSPARRLKAGRVSVLACSMAEPCRRTAPAEPHPRRVSAEQVQRARRCVTVANGDVSDVVPALTELVV